MHSRVHQGALAAGALLPLAAAALVWTATSRFGVGVTPDSAAYLSAAESLGQGTGLRLFDGSPYADWPPLYPASVAGLALPGLPVQDAARALQAGTAAALVAAAMLLAVRLGGSALAAFVTAAVAMLAPPFVAVLSMAWSEGLFVVFVLGFFLALDRDREQASPASWVALAAFAAAASATRYIGIVLVPLGAVAIARRGSFRAAAFAVAALAPLALWAARNQVTVGAAFGRRRPGGRPLSESWSGLDAELASWLAPGFDLALGIALAAFALLVVVAWWRSPRAAPLGVFAFVYPVLLVVIAMRTPLDEIGPRLLFPVAIALAVVAGALAGRSRVAAILALVWIVAALPGTGLALGERVRDGAGGYSTTRWRGSALAAHLATLERREHMPIYTNAPDLLWAIHGRAASFTPWRASESGESPPPLPGREWPSGEFRVVWFDRVDRAYLRPLDELELLLHLTPTASFADGRVFRGRRELFTASTEGVDSP